MSRPSKSHVKAVAIVVVVVAAEGCSSSHHASQAGLTTEVPAATAVPTTVTSTPGNRPNRWRLRVHRRRAIGHLCASRRPGAGVRLRLSKPLVVT